MNKFYRTIVGLLLVSLMVVPVFGQEIEPNDTIANATPLALNIMSDAALSATDTIDVWEINADASMMYTLATQTNPLVFNAKSVLKMDVVDANNVSVLNADPSSRYEKFGAILRGWTPAETGMYYVKIWGTPEALAAEVDPSYQMRFWYGTTLDVASTTHEPDDSVDVAVNLPAIPTDGTVIHGYLYNAYTEADTFATNWNDFDLYKVEVPEAGMILIAETTTPGRVHGHPEWIRETDTEIHLLLDDGSFTPIKNDDKAVWAGDPWEDILTFNNTFSRFISPPIPAAGTYYIHVNSYYCSGRIEGRNRDPHSSHRNAGGGEYLLSANLMAADDFRLLAERLPLNDMKDGSVSGADTMDVWTIGVSDDRMYTIATQTDPAVFNAKSVLKMDVVDANNVSVLNADPSSRYEKFGAILRGWTPAETGIYFVKVWGAPDALAAEADPSYMMRLSYGTPLDVAATVHEPDDSVDVAVNLPAIPTDGTVIHGYLYNAYTEADTFATNWNDFDLYKVEVPEAGMVLIAETTTPGRTLGHPEWIRETDTEIHLLDAEGNFTPIKNDDKAVWAGDPWEDIVTFNNTFSRFVSPPIPDAGTYYIHVNSYYCSGRIEGRNRDPHTSHRNAGGGEYLLSARLVAAEDIALVAETLPLNEMKDGSISDADTMDVWAIGVADDRMYTIATQTDPLVFNAKSVLKMDVVDENNVSVMNADPSSRYEKFGCILRGWTPAVTGVYYVKVWGAPDALAAEADPSYMMRLSYGTPLEVASTVHEPDDSVAVAAALPPIPTDGTVIRGYLYNDYMEADTFRTNWNDFDLYKVEVPESGMILIAETTTPGRAYGHPEWIRETDTEIHLLDADGNFTPIKNDDKAVWAGDPWEDILTFNNTFSRFVSPPIPDAGTYYIHVNSYYCSGRIEGRNRDPHTSHRNAGGGEYLLSARLVTEGDPALMAENLPLNEMKDGSVSQSDTMDVWAIGVMDDRMYTIATQTDPAVFNAKSVLKMDVVNENNVSVMNADPSSRYEKFGCILRGWTPDVTGVYYVKVWGAPDALAAEENPSYQMRLWYGTPLSVAATEHEPDDSVSVASALPAIPTDGTVIHGYLYNEYTEGDTFKTNWNDFDLYKVEVPAAGMIMTAETFTPGRAYDHPEWIRETDTEIHLLDADGNFTPIKSDDKDVWAGDPWEEILTFNNTFSRFVSPPMPDAGTYYIHVNSYYCSGRIEGRNRDPHTSHRNAGGGEYMLSVTLTLPQEQEPNNDMATANIITLQTVTDAMFAADDSVDYFQFWAEADKMYSINTIAPRGQSLKGVVKADVLDESGMSILNASINDRYEKWGARLAGWVPPATGNYFVRLSAVVTEETAYQIRLWYGTPLQVASTVHEPDDSVAVASLLDAVELPFEIHSYLYNEYVDSLGMVYNWNDFDLYKVELSAGDTLVAETITAGGPFTGIGPDSSQRDLDTEIHLLDSEGNFTPIKNDDKDVWYGDMWEEILGFNNTFSRFISPPIPDAGTYYVHVNSYYCSGRVEGRDRNPADSHRNPGGGEYILKISLGTAKVGVADSDAGLPMKFELSQNYPNPFNPTTTIKYSIPNNEIVKLTVYNVMGQRVAQLVNEKQVAGRYSVVWDATNSKGINMTSGVYFFKIEAGSDIQVNKMMLLK